MVWQPLGFNCCELCGAPLSDPCPCYPADSSAAAAAVPATTAASMEAPDEHQTQAKGAGLASVDFAPFLTDVGCVVGDAPTPAQLACAAQIDSACRVHGFLVSQLALLFPRVHTRLPHLSVC